MKLLYSWLRELSGTALGPAELAAALTMRGTAIASIDRTAPAYAHMVSGRVLETRPLGDRLVMTRVTVGSETLDIACGAPNVRTGMNVAVALSGAKLPGGQDIGVRSIQGVESRGMILSLAELGLSSDGGAAGIHELDPGIAPGEALAGVLGLDDAVLEAEITFNRGDCLSHLGVAREIAALEKGTLRIPAEPPAREGAPIEGRVSVRIEAPEGCPRYIARAIEQVTIAPSPLAIARRLALLGSRLVNNVVDATNYVLLETGQPLHAFDVGRVAGGAIVVRFAPGETLVTLDGDTRKIPPETLAICDRSHPIGFAGIMGGKESEVSDQTRSILLEAAEFDPVVTRRGARAIGLATEASYRFERGVDPAGVEAASRYAASLIARISGGLVAKGAARAEAAPPRGREITLRPARVNRLLGSEIGADSMAADLRALGMEVSGSDPLRVRVPTWRRDCLEEVDLIEEVARSYGYDRLPSRSAVGKTVSRDESARARIVERTREILPGLGFSEVFTVSLIDGDRASAWHAALEATTGAPVRVSNPISEALSTLRPHLLPGVLASLALNLNRRRRDPRFFEMGGVFTPAAGDPRPEERWHLAIALSGAAREPAWDDPSRPADFFDLRGLLEAYHAALGIAAPEFRPVSWPLFGEGMGAEIVFDHETIGFMGDLGEGFRHDWGLRQATLVMELDLDRLAAAAAAVSRRHRELPRHPALERDIAVVVDAAVPHGTIERLLREEGGELVEATRLFDCYVGDPLPPGKKSLAYTVRLRAPERTLTEDEAQAVRQRIAERVSRELGATLRE